MAGLLTPNSQPQAPQEQAGADRLNDPVLKQIEQGIEEKIPAEMKDAYMAIVVAGMQVMFSKETSQLLDQALDKQGDIATNVADGVSRLLVLVYNESKKAGEQGGMDVRMAVPAGITLMCQALDYWEATRNGQVTPELAADCTQKTMRAILKMFGIKDEQVDQTMQAGLSQGGGQQDQGAPATAAPQPMTGA